MAAEFTSGKVVVSIETLLKNLDRDAKRLEAFKKTLQSVANIKPGDTQRNIKRTTDATQRLAESQQRVINRQKNLEASTIRATNALERARLATQRLDQAKARLGRSTLPALDKQLNKIGGTLNRVGSGLRSFGTSLTVGLTAPLTALGLIAVKSARDIDDQANTLKAFTGSAEAAEKRLSQLINTAQRTPGLTTSLGLLLDSQLRVAEVTVETIDKILPAMGKLNAVSRLQDPQRFAQNMVQLVTQNFERIDLKELVGQSPLAGQIIKELFNVDSPINAEAIRESAKKMGLTTTDAFFAAFAEAAGRNQALATITESISSRFGKAVDRVMIALRPLGLAIVNAITPAINALVPFIEKLGKAFADLPQPAQQAILILGGLAALLGPALVVIGGIVTSLGGLMTALAAIGGVIGTIGFPALLAILAGLVVQITALATAATVLFKAWQTNFLGLRDIVARAANAVLKAFREIRGVVNEATQRILPTLQSITNKVVTAITRIWETYGKRVLEVVGGAFRFISDVTQTFLRQFGNFIDLILKLIDSDWQGAWRAFSRIVITAVDSIQRLLGRLNQVVVRALRLLIGFILSQAAQFALAAKGLAEKFLVSLAAEIILGAPKIRNALADMLLLAAIGVNPTGIARLLVDRLFAAMRKAAGEGGIPAAPEPGIGVDVGAGAGLFRKKKPSRTGAAAGGDDKQARTILDRLKQAQDEFATAQAEARLALQRSAVEQQFQLAKDGLDRELELLNANFEDRSVAVKKYFAERYRLQEAQIEAELIKERALSDSLAQEFENRRNEIDREFKTTKEDIERDPKLTGRGKTLALQTAEQKRQTDLAKALNDFETQNGDISSRILILKKALLRIAEDSTREEKRLTEELQRQQDQLQIDLFEEQGDIGGAATERLRAQFKDTLKELRVDISSLSPELQAALNRVDLSVLRGKLEQLPEPVRILIELLDIGIAKARIAERAVDVDRTLAELRLEENKIQNKVLDGVLTERKARAEILGLQQTMRDRLLDTLAAQLAIARAAVGQEDAVLRIQAQIDEIQRLGRVIDDVGQQINRDLFGDIQSGLEGIFNNARRGFEGLKDAAISFGESLLNTLNRIAAASIMQKLEGIFRPDSENTEGTPGGFLSKLFGLSPDSATASNTTATEQNTAAINSLTTAFGGQAVAAIPGTGGQGGGGVLRTIVNIGSSILGGLFGGSGGDEEAEGGLGTAAAGAVSEGEGGGGFLNTLGNILGGIFGGFGGTATGIAQQGSTVIQALNIVSQWLAKLVDALNANTQAQQSGGGGGFVDLASMFFGGFAAGGIIQAQPEGSIIRVGEAGHRELVLTEDPRHAVRQVALLREYLTRTKGLFGRVRIPEFAEGGFIPSRAEAERDMLSSINRAPAFSPRLSDAALETAGNGLPRNVRIILVNNQNEVKEWVNSPDGAHTIVQQLARNRPAVIRLLKD